MMTVAQILDPRYSRRQRPAARGLINGLVALYRKAGAWGKVGVEIGCYTGESAEIGALFLKQLYCVDPWEGGRSRHEPEFDLRLARFANVIKMKTTSHDAATKFANSSIDILYLDGRHDYGNVRQDILDWFPKVRMGGHVSGHDYNEGKLHAGLVRAVNEVLGKPEMTFCDSSWMFRKTPDLTRRLRASGGMP